MARIQVRNLGQALLYCPRCLWIRHRYALDRDHPLWSPMPGVFSILDDYTKETVGRLLNSGGMPRWLAQEFPALLPPLRVIHPPRWGFWVLKFGDAEVVGVPDCIIVDTSNQWYILDYKTARWTENQEAIWPLYEAQVNGYAWLARKLENAQVAGLGVVYFEPVTDSPLSHDTFDMVLPFQATLKPVAIWPDDRVEDLIQQTMAILDAEAPPDGKDGCPKCAAFERWKQKIP